MKTIKVKISVTAEDIEHGEKQNCRFCPIALASFRSFRESLIGHDYFYCEIHEIILVNIRGRRAFVSENLTEDVLNFIDDFDSGKEVSPFEFEAVFEERPMQ